MNIMKRIAAIVTFAVITLLLQSCSAQTDKNPWTQQQLMKPADLAAVLNNPDAKQPIVFSIGPQAVIKNSTDIGPTGRSSNLDKFQAQLSKLPKDANIVIYCGCCPFSRCPNVRPAFNLLNEMGFKNQKLLNLAQNIKVDWIDKGYPLNQ